MNPESVEFLPLKCGSKQEVKSADALQWSLISSMSDPIDAEYLPCHFFLFGSRLSVPVPWRKLQLFNLHTRFSVKKLLRLAISSGRLSASEELKFAKKIVRVTLHSTGRQKRRSEWVA